MIAGVRHRNIRGSLPESWIARLIPAMASSAVLPSPWTVAEGAPALLRKYWKLTPKAPRVRMCPACVHPSVSGRGI